MSNPASARRAPAPDHSLSRTSSPPRRRLARALPAGTALAACLLLGAAAAVDGRAAALVLAVWVAALVVVGMRLSEPRRRSAPAAPRIVRRPVLMLAEMTEDGAIGATRTLPVVASAEAIAVLDSRPHG
jgi:hypothetical protein